MLIMILLTNAWLNGLQFVKFYLSPPLLLSPLFLSFSPFLFPLSSSLFFSLFFIKIELPAQWDISLVIACWECLVPGTQFGGDCTTLNHKLLPPLFNPMSQKPAIAPCKKPVIALPARPLCREGQIFGVGSCAEGATFHMKTYGNDSLNESFSLHFSNAFAHIFEVILNFNVICNQCLLQSECVRCFQWTKQFQA